MAKIRVKGDTSGYIDVAAPATADNSTLDLSTVAKTTGATFTGQVSSTISSSTDPAGYFRNTSGSGDSPALVARGGANNNNAPTFQVEDYAGNVDFKVDGNGRVTMPYQPMFTATGGLGSQTAGVFRFDRTSQDGFNLNVGNHYNTSNYRFTAPVTGKYFFCFNVYTDGTNLFDAEFFINGSGKGPSIQDLTTRSGANAYVSMTASIVMPLSDGDYVDVRTTRNVYIDSNCFFSGYLIG